MTQAAPMPWQRSRTRRHGLRALAVFLLLAACSGCVLIPGAGPLKSEVGNQGEQDEPGLPFAVVDVTERTVGILRQQDGASLVESMVTRSKPPQLVVGLGDELAVSIWEAGAQPLFSASSASVSASAGARVAQLPAQTVDASGSISVPYVGRVEVAGLSLDQIEAKVRQELGGKAARPQVIVTLTAARSGSVSVLGHVGRPGRVPLSPARERLLDVLAEAGGVPLAPYEAQVMLTRNDSSARVPLSTVLDNPRENIFLFPGDIIAVSRSSRKFTAFGATGKNARIPFEGESLNLIEALALAGGLLDLRANPRGVYLLRREPAAVAASLTDGQFQVAGDAQAAIVYRLDLSRVDSYFLGQDFEVNDGDMLYVANAATTSVRKILELFGLVTQPIIQGVVFDKAVD